MPANLDLFSVLTISFLMARPSLVLVALIESKNVESSDRGIFASSPICFPETKAFRAISLIRYPLQDGHVVFVI
ncbi:MAG: hypothetical protein AMQ22_02287 [Candidatus Methanofastidiosum methylothiophilum]|uniref:Uncharacterized protein n=1 Tax=Candidatus Methanofastidiosum methylothiophilum TaxID=1705564 RepID=A0A150IHU3_9EURY|nr:MAG: hypothetical protein AMQ22_02287 [Candidatus Methanofastidiosum methylthiophilus]